MKKRWLLIVAAVLLIACGLAYFKLTQSVTPAKAGVQSSNLDSRRSGNDDLNSLKEKLLSQLQKPEDADRTLEIPVAKPEPKEKPSAPPPTLTAEQLARAEGRKKRELLPLGVILQDNVTIYKSADGKEPLYKMSTGDFVKVYADSTHEQWHVHPGVDVYLAATSKEIETAGNRFPDKDGWVVDRAQINVFRPERAKEFTQTTDPMTLGHDPDFSTVDFYERAFKNPDPVVHRVIGPRLIALLSLHEDYSSGWGRLYRDPDEKIRAVTLAALKERGVGQSAPLIEDLIARLVELKSAGRDKNDPEIALVSVILKESGSPRAQNALKSINE